ncbi:MAG: threonine synthase [Acidobacteriota bacterium]|nr:threonine synthase [Acidobacteriota bacterium]
MLEKYRELLPLDGVATPEALGEGNTPLVKSSSLQESGELFFKLEQLNPTGSFKDRFAAVEIALIKDAGLKSCIATSSGNTGSALAAYSARHGIRCLLFVNEVAPLAKLKQMLVYGARVFRVKDFGVSNEQSALIFERLEDLAQESQTRLVISAYRYSPGGMAGVKTIAYEIAEQLKRAPDQVFVPVGGGGLLSSLWRGFLDLKERALIDRLPRVNAVQPTLNDTVVTPVYEGRSEAREVNTTTTISGLAVQVDIDATLALRSVRDSGGWGYLVTDEEIRKAQQELCRREGLFVEPAGAASVAGYLKASAEGRIEMHEKVVCILTGHGLKDTSSAERNGPGGQIIDLDLSGLTSTLIRS